MGFFKKIKKAFKKVTKPVAKVVKKVTKPVAQIGKSVIKNALPVAGQIAGAYLGSGASSLVSKGVGSVFGSTVGNAAGKILGGSVNDTFQQYANSLSGYGNQYNGVSMPQGYDYSYGGYTHPTAPQLNQSNTLKDAAGGVSFIKNFETPIKSAAEQGKDTRAYLAAAYPEMNPWERSGTGGTMFGSDMTGAIQDQEAQNKQLASTMELQKMQNSKDILLAKLQSDTALRTAQMNNEAALASAGIASQTSRLNTRDQVEIGQQNVELAERRLNADVQKIAADTDMSVQSRKESIAREIKTYAESQNIQLTGKQIIALTEEAYARAQTSRAQTGLIGKQTESEGLRQPGIIQSNENLRYGQGSIMRELNSAGNFIDDSLSAIKNKWNEMWGDSDGVSGSMSRK